MANACLHFEFLLNGRRHRRAAVVGADGRPDADGGIVIYCHIIGTHLGNSGRDGGTFRFLRKTYEKWILGAVVDITRLEPVLD